MFCSKLFGLRVSVEMAKGHGHSKQGGGGTRGYMGGGGGGGRYGGTMGREGYGRGGMGMEMGVGGGGGGSRRRDYDYNDDSLYRDRSPVRSSRRSPDYSQGSSRRYDNNKHIYFSVIFNIVSRGRI